MKLIVGLGNPGKKYEKTRHNLGFMVLDEFLRQLAGPEETIWQEIKKARTKIYKDQKGSILAKPQTMMNNSGLAVTKTSCFFKIKPEDIWVVHDELDLPLGKIKIVRSRGAAGHKGVASIIKELGTNDFVRFRLGIGWPEHKLNEREAQRYVLSPFTKKEKSQVKRLLKKTIKAVKLALDEGLEKAENQFN
ncbi:MAG TPA: aminoacyl-tRNA hydrolase [Candidatus Bathyarchaeia archaeon]|nr:aminoacyl-tRNA hydrolase [Candidatus Bathyarchaeia archaeon]